MTFPACFNSQQEFDIWLAFRRISGEKCSYCDDCTAEYHDRMTMEHRCYPPARKVSPMQPKQSKVKKCSHCGTQDPEEFSPKNFYACRVCANARKMEWKRSVSNVRTQAEAIKRSESQVFQDRVAGSGDGETRGSFIFNGIVAHLLQRPLLGCEGGCHA